MFIDQKAPSPAPTINQIPERPKVLIGRKEMIIISVIAGVIVVAAGGWWWWSNMNKTAPEPIVQEEPKDNTGLPSTLNPVDNEEQPNEPNSNIKGENVTFGAFYKSETKELDIKIPGVALPLNIKSQVSNYYDTARKINIDPIIGNLNQDGFATLDSPFTKSNNDFFGTYAELKQRSIPIVVSSDFLVYYYQNSLKQIYKEIETSYFYESLWRINKSMYDRANGRYQDRRSKLGVSSDPLLEAERLEAAYFAVGLMLLKPQAEQINATEDLNNNKKFKPSEASRYDFSLPSYLSEDVSKEVTLIREARAQAKSPALLYNRDYKEFKLPAEYTETAKLSNFFIASRWNSSLFPLYFKEANCANCLLDREDWIINQTAAHLVASDLSADQSLKNEWAKIYKVISYFSGLRSELTYLHFETIRKEIYKEASIEEVFGTDSFERLIKMRDELAKLNFNEAEGGYPRNDSTKPYLGMRLLQSSYWPNRSFYDQLTFAKVGNHKQPTINNSRTSYLSSCDDRGKLFRCRGIGFDVLRPILNSIPKSKFLSDNANYENYVTQSDILKTELKKFDAVSWHANNFWSTLNVGAAYINTVVPALPYMSSERWLERKISTSLAMLANLSLSADAWTLPRDKKSSGLEVTELDGSFNYIEPDLALSDELVANTKMLFETLIGIEVVKDNDLRFNDLIGKLSMSRDIIRKELQNQEISSDEYQFISDFTGQFSIAALGSKTNTITFNDPATGKQYSLKQNSMPLKLIFIIYNKAGKRVIAAGPIFSYKEQQ